MKHVGAIAGRELRSLFVSPVAYVVLTLFSVISGFLFFTSVLAFDAQIAEVQQLQLFDYLAEINLNDHLIGPFLSVMWIVLLFLVPGITMGLLAAEKTNGTQELLLTSPITIWELVLGKYLAAAAFVTLLILIVGLYCGILFLYGDSELSKTVAGLLGLYLVALTYAAIGLFASSVTRNQLIAFFLALVLLFILWLLSIVADLGAAGGALGGESLVSSGMRYLASAEKFENMIKGLVDTRDLAYFAFLIATSLVLTKTTIESVRWR
ncbi:MAG: ABC transporter permease subunit [Myxococcota bacterium]